jgi:hypothetical protein
MTPSFIRVPAYRQTGSWQINSQIKVCVCPGLLSGFFIFVGNIDYIYWVMVTKAYSILIYINEVM